jgi:hypothetical protein
MKKTILLFLLSSFLFSCNIREQSDIQKDVMSEDDVIEVNVKDLIDSFVKDSSASAEKYIGKVLIVNGEVAAYNQFDPIKFNTNDSLPFILKWILKRAESDINTGNIVFKSTPNATENRPNYSVSATFPKEYRDELVNVKEDMTVKVKGKLEYISTISQTQSDSTKVPITYILSLQGCLLEK